jgi:hypothetical protein
MPTRFRSPLLFLPLRALDRRARTTGAVVLVAAIVGSSCGVDSAPLFQEATPLSPAAGRPGNLPTYPAGLPGSGGSEGGLGQGAGPGEGAVGRAQQQQNEPDAATPDGAAGFDAAATCEQESDCEDGNACTFDDCVGGTCQHTSANAGFACGSSTENACTGADACDSAGHCLRNDAAADTPCGRTDNACAADACDGAGACVPHDLAAGMACGVANDCGQSTCRAGAVCQADETANGSACPGGSCTLGACVAGQRVGCPQQVVSSVPFQMNWSSVGRPDLFRGACESSNTPDAAVVFLVPAAGRYRFEATGSPDSMLALVRGACGQGNAAEIACNDDISDGVERGSRIDVALTANQTITVYVSEFDDNNSGSGTLRISAL